MVNEAKRLCRKLLKGVGRSESEFWKLGEICGHYRRIMTSEEVSLLDPRWMKLTPIDEAG
jgi:hypothetical protein